MPTSTCSIKCVVATTLTKRYKLSKICQCWPQATAILVEAQALGEAVVAHLKHAIPGLIPITVKGSKQLRARDCMPVWQSKNVYIPKPDNGDYARVREYLQELLNFPNAAHDDQVDATTLALNQLHGPLFRKSNERMVETSDSQPEHSELVPGHYYFTGWIPALSPDSYTVLVFDITVYGVVYFGRFPAVPLENQLRGVQQISRYYNRAVVRAFDDRNRALVSDLEMREVWVERVSRSKLEDSYANLAILIENDMITIPSYRELQAELDVFKSGFTYDESADYSLQAAQQSAIRALCLVTHDISPGLIRYRRRQSVYYSYDRYLIGDVTIHW
ncbi:MAG: hypothetical protein ABSE80_11320 [Halobacteriota archaeon]